MNYIKELNAYREHEIEVFRKLNLEDVNTVMNVLEKARVGEKKIFICGNGGSAATASHFAGDFNKGINMGIIQHAGLNIHNMPCNEIKNGLSLYNFECLSDNVPTMMAVSNDESYSESFRFPLLVKMQKGDIIIGISGSGNSLNVVNAFEYAKKIGGITIAIVGYTGGKMKEIADYSIHIEVNDMQISEDLHMVLDHMMMSVFVRKLNK